MLIAASFLWLAAVTAHALSIAGTPTISGGTVGLGSSSPVSNVTFAQRTDGTKLVDVRYTLAGGSYGIALAFSVDGGTTYSALSAVTGDVGMLVAAGTSKQIVWKAGTEFPNANLANVRFRVTPLLSGAGGSFAPIPGGTYQMGNLVGDADITDAGTVTVMLSPYYMSVNHTTKAQWDLVRTWAASKGYTDLKVGGGKAPSHPVHSVSWYDALKWANAASEMDGLTPCYKLNGAVLRTGTSDAVTCDWAANGYRLPTEAEWEVAARGGLKGKRFPLGDTISHSQANYKASSGSGYDSSGAANSHHPTYRVDPGPYTSPVGSFAPNGYGLYDMAGNVFQWCWDWYGSTYSGGTDPRGAASGSWRIRRGGYFDYTAASARTAARGAYSGPADTSDYYGYGVRFARSWDMVALPGGTLPDGSALKGQVVGDFQIGRTEVTWGEWKTVRQWAVANGYSDLEAGQGDGDNHPVRDVSWYDVVKWCNAKSEREGKTPVYHVGGTPVKNGQSVPSVNQTADGYRLPTEAEWEWAARGGKQTRGYKFSGGNDLTAVAWYRDNAGGTQTVGTKFPNELGIYDMTGNVFEWCWDLFSGTSNRVLRGGAWNGDANNDGDGFPVSNRASGTATYRNNAVGFRLARNRADGSGGAAFSPTGALDTTLIAKIFEDVTPQVTGLTGYSSATLREVANAGGTAPYYVSTDNDVLKLYALPSALQFSDVTSKVLPAGFKWIRGTRLVVADFDNNGAQDLVLWEPTGLRVLLNTAGTFKETPVAAGLNPRLAELHRTLLDVLTADLDGDGDLDLVFRYVVAGNPKPGRVACVYNDAIRTAEGRRGWAANAAGFARVADVLSLPYAFGGLFAADLNLDGRVDFILGEKGTTFPSDNSEQRPLHLFINKGAGVLEEDGAPLTGMADYAFAFADYQNTGRLDLIQGSSDWVWDGSYPHAYWSGETGSFEKSAEPVLERVTGDHHFALSPADFDLDGRSDAFWTRLGRYLGGLSTGPLRMWRTTGAKTFQDVSSEWGFTFSYPAGSSDYSATVADFDNDGAPDLLINASPWEGSTQRLYRNTAAQRGTNYLKIRLTGVTSARDGTGARIEVRAGGNVAVRYNTGSDPSNLPFGLGTSKTADLVKVYWPSGKVSEARNVPGNQWLEIVEPAFDQFEIVRGVFTWSTAKADAEKRGGRLAVLSTKELFTRGHALQTAANMTSIWLGATDKEVNGTWRWLDGSLMTFSNWSRSEPNDCFGPASENHLEMYPDGTWNDLPDKEPFYLYGYLLERVGGMLRITKQPESVAANFAAPFTLNITAEGLGNLAYQWFKDGQEIVGATSSTLTVSALTRAAVGTYWVVVSEGGKQLTSEKAVVTMANPPPVPLEGLLGWWPLDGNAVDQSPNAIHGTLSGLTAGIDRFNRATRTLEFASTGNVSAYVDFGAADKLRVQGDSTVVLWVKFADSDTPVPQIFNFGSGQFELSASAGRGARVLQYTVGGVTLRGARLLETGKWHHVAAVRKAGRGFLYVNGRLDAEGVMGTAPAFGPRLNLGRNATLSNGAFAGAMDDLRIYGKALTTLEIEALAGQPDAGEILPPVIVQEPKSLTVDEGAAAQFAVRASGSRGVLYYQWLKDGVAVPGATAAVLTLGRVEARQIGVYACVVSDGYTNVTSAGAALGMTGVNSGLWQGLVGHWKLDGNGLDSSGFANHATIRGTPLATADRLGGAAGAYSFSGNGSYLEVSDRAAFDLENSDATLSAWVKTASAAQSWLLSKMDPAKAGGIGIGAGPAASLSSRAVTYFKLSHDLPYGAYQRIRSVAPVNLVTGNIYEVTAVLPLEAMWHYCTFEFSYPASILGSTLSTITEPVPGSAQRVQVAGDHVRFQYQLKSLVSAGSIFPQFAFFRNARDLVEIGNIELRNLTTGELLTPPLDSPTLATQWTWDSAESVKFRAATIGAAGTPMLAARTQLWGNGVASAKQASDSVLLADDKWHLVTSVYDRRGKMRLYVDGTERVETDITPADIAVGNEHPLLIGSAVGATSLTGSLDDVRWYNRALSDADVLALYRQNAVLDTDGDGLSDAYEYGWGRYEIVPGSFTWAEAKAHAEARGGHLATITSEAEWQAIKTVVGPAVMDTTLWLGGTDEGSEGRWRWITGEKWNFAKWGRNPGWGQEPNGATSENTLMLWTDPAYVDRPNGFIWNDSNNVVRWSYLFERGYFTDGTKWDTDGDGVSDADEIKSGTDPTNPDSGLSGTYRVIEGKYTWHEAKADAEARGGHLVTVTSPSEWALIKSLIGLRNTPLWMGGSDARVEGTWEWVTGEKWDFSAWGGPDPNGAGFENYTLLFPGYDSNWNFVVGDDPKSEKIPDGTEIHWVDIQPNHRLGYILEIEPKVQNRYAVVEGSFTWKEAKMDAEKRGGHLVTVANAAEWEAIRFALGEKFDLELWMGGTSEAEVGKWTWVTGEPFNFAVWGPDQPDNPVRERYLEKKPSNFWNGLWNDLTNAGQGPPPHGPVGYILEIERKAADLNLAITTQPAPVTVPAIGGTASFGVTATGLGPLTYQWRKDGIAISGADQATLSLKNVSPAQIGKYTVVVGDASGKTFTSDEADLAITGVNSGIWAGLVAYYPFHGSANDESGNGNHGTVNGAKLVADRFGSQTQAYEFDGLNSSIEVPDSPSLRPSKQTTVSAWVNMRKLGRYLRVISKGVAIAGSYGSYQLITGSNLNDTFHDAPLFTVRTSDGYYVPDPATGQPIQQWVQIVGTYDGQKTKLFYDGLLVAEAPSSGNLMYDANRLVIGRDLFYAQSFDGKIDDIRIYNRALTSAEVKALYDAEKAVPPVITKQPVGLRMPPGSSGRLGVEATGDAPLAYQWQKDGVDISGATNRELPLTSVTEALQGSYRVRVSNGAGAVFSEAVLVDVLDSLGNVTVYVAKNGSDTGGDGTQAKPFATIGKAVNAAASGSRILVGPGTYAERVEYSGKTLRIHSSEGPVSTILQGATGNTVVYIDAAAVNSELRGFKITGGIGRPTPSSFGFDYYGGGLYCGATAFISDCIFEGNGKGTPRVNSATFGGAIYSTGGKLQVVNCLLHGNYAWASGGASLTEAGSIEFDRCTVYGNDATQFYGRQGGLAVANGGRMLVRNCIVWGNTGSQLGAFGWPYNVGTEIVVEYSDIQSPNDGGGAQTFRNGTGNLSADPLFADAAAKNFALRTGSPALDKADPGLPKEKDGTSADMGWRADRFGGEAVIFGSRLFTDVTDAVRLPEHEVLAEFDGGQGSVTDRLVRVADGTLQLWRATGAFGYRDVTVGAGLPKDLLAPGLGGYFAVGDVDNNGAQDLVVWDASGLRVFLNTAGTFKAATVPPALNEQAVALFPKSRGTFTLADLDGDGDLDVVFNYETSGADPGRIAQITNGARLDGAPQRRVWLAGDGFVGIQDVLKFPWQKPHFSVTDSNADGLPDLVVLETNGSWPADTHVSHKAHVFLNKRGSSVPAGMKLIGGGEFKMGDSLDGDADRAVHSVYLDPFFIGTTLVSASEWKSVADWAVQNGYAFTYGDWGEGASLPATNLNWWDAVKWCNAKSEKEGRRPCYYTSKAKTPESVFKTGEVDISNDMVDWTCNGYRLLTEAEWEKAARGGLESKRFPWGDVVSHADANYASAGNLPYDKAPSSGYHPDFKGNKSPLTSFSQNGYGLYGMAGSASSWCWDWMSSIPASAVVNPKGPLTGTQKLTRGGTALDSAASLRVFTPVVMMPKWGGTYIGMRLAVSAKNPINGGTLARYAIIPGSYTFLEAQADAVSKGGHLLTVSSAAEWQAVLGELTSRATAEDLWIGAQSENSKWGWVTGEAFGYVNWDGGVPDSGSAGVHSAKGTGKWRTAAAGAKMGYLLEWEPAFQEVEDAGLADGNEFSNFLSVDVDGDGILDLVNGSSDWPGESSPKVFYGNGDGTYRQKASPFVGSDRFYHHVARVADIDLDGRMDGWWSGLHNFSDLRVRLWRGLQGGTFAEVASEWGVDVGLDAGNLFLSGYLADWDGDGDLDLVARATGQGSGRYRVYRNNAADLGGRWLRVRLVGVESPRDGTGARVRVVSGERAQTQYVGNISSDGSPVATLLSFGLGNAQAADQLVVTWPNGQEQVLGNVPAGQVVEIRQNTVAPDWLKFTEQPVGRTVVSGTLVVFSATAVGSGSISYQWFKDGVALTGGTASTYRIASAAVSSVGDYQVVATNGVAKVASALARLEVVVPPSIVTQPVPVSVVAGTDVVFAVDAVGTAPLSYQWLKGTSLMTGGTGRTLSLKGVGAADVAIYSVRVTNPAGNVTSSKVALSLLTPVQITKHPVNVSVNEGATLTLSVTATGSPVLKYQWYRDAKAIVGGTSASFAVSKASTLDAGSYSVTVSNPAGETSSTAALVSVNLAPRLSNVEENVSVKEGTSFTLTASATGAAPLAYTWSRNGTVLPAQKGATLSVASATLLDSGVYTVEVRNVVGVASAKVATVSVQAIPRIVTQPVGIDAVEGTSAVLSVVATGALPLNYQWYKGGTVLPGETGPVLSFNPLLAAIHAGTYSVQVSNTVGRVLSGVAPVAVQPALRITTQPASAELTLGGRGTFSVVASGAGPLTYQWYKDGAMLPAATDDTFIVPSVGKYSIGDYSVVVKDRFANTLRSEVAALTVAGEPSTYWKGLMAHWKFSGDTRDGTPFLNHGKGTNVQVVPDRFGLQNSALRFSGKLNPLAKASGSQRSVAVAHSDSLQPAARYTVVAWAKPEFAGENLAEITPFVLGKRSGTALRDSSYALSAGFGTGGLTRLNGGGAQTGYVTGGSLTLQDGQWQMVALTFDGGSLTLYRNGQKIATQAAASNQLVPSSVPLLLGSGSGDGYQDWFGCLDDVRLYNKVLSAAELADLYTAENTPPVGAMAPPAIVVQPVGYTVPAGGAVTLRVEANGGAPLVYQWMRDGIVLSGGTSAEYRIASAGAIDQGSYTVEVSNVVGVVRSIPVLVNVTAVVDAGVVYVSKIGNDTTGSGTVSAPYLTISKAVQAARAGMRILVGPGTYAERIEYGGKMLVIESSNGALETVLQGVAGHSAVYIDAAATNSELRGFRITGGTGRRLSPTGTTTSFTGGGVCVLTSALVQDCIIEGNGNPTGVRFSSQASFGGGVYSTGGTTRLLNCLIIGNHASEAGGGVFAERGTCELDQCTVYGNTVGKNDAEVGGLAVRNAGWLVVRNSIVRGNAGKQIGSSSFPANRDTSVQIEYSNIEGGAVAPLVLAVNVGEGNSSADPLFVDVGAKNFALRSGSPALDAAAPGLPKEADGTAADMGYRQDRFKAKKARIDGPLFVEVPTDAEDAASFFIRLTAVDTGTVSGTGAGSKVTSSIPYHHSLVAMVDSGATAKPDRLVRYEGQTFTVCKEVNGFFAMGRETPVYVRLWRATGDFAAVDVTESAGLPSDLDRGLLAVGDVDNNGSQDIVSWNEAGLRVYLNTAGVFKAQTLPAALLEQAKALWTQNAGNLEVADLNGDGLLDLVFRYSVKGTSRPGRIGVFLASGTADAAGRRTWGATGGFAEFREVQSFFWSNPDFSLADVNGDGLTDFVVLESEASYGPKVRRPVHVYLNKWKTNTSLAASARYELVPGNFTWEQAKADAENRGGHLAAAGNEAEWQVVRALAGYSAATNGWWLGATDSLANGEWRWVTGERWGFTPVNAGAGAPWVPVGVGTANYLSAAANGDWSDQSNAGTLRGYILERPPGADLVLNGGFEDIEYVRVDLAELLQLPSGLGLANWARWSFRKSSYTSDRVSGWSTKSGNVDFVLSDSTVQSWQSSAGEVSVDLAGNSDAVQFQQPLKTKVGRAYVLEFDYSRNPSLSAGTASLRVEVTGKAPLINETVSHGLPVTKSSMQWRRYSKRFVADSETTVLAFSNVSPLGVSGGAALDEVHVYEDAAPLFPEVFNHGITGAAESNKFQFVDLNGDGKLDLVGASTVDDKGEKNGAHWFEGLGDGTFKAHPVAAGAWIGDGLLSEVDADLDGALDPVWFSADSFGKEGARLWRGMGADVFQDVTSEWGVDSALSAGSGFTDGYFSDWDGDGAPDLVLRAYSSGWDSGGAFRVYRNQSVSRGARVVRVRLEGVRSPRDGQGAVIEFTAGGRKQVRYMGSPTLGGSSVKTFALGTAAAAEKITVRWPSGAVQEITNVGSSALVDIKESVVPPDSIVVLRPPQPVLAGSGQSVVLACEAVGIGPGTLAYQWFKNGVAVSGATRSTHQIAVLRASDAGDYTVRITFGSAVVRTSPVAVELALAPTIATQPRAVEVLPGQTARFSVNVSGTGPFTYQWFKGGVAIAGAVNASLTLADVGAASLGSYTVRVTNGLGSVTSSSATLALASGPVFAKPLVGGTFAAGGAVALTAVCTGTAPMTYQWYKDGDALEGANSPNLALRPANLSHAGAYSVTVGNAFGVAESAVANVQIVAPPSIVEQPVALSVVLGRPFSLRVRTSLGAAQTFQWFKGSAAIAGATATEYAVPSARLTDAGSYSVNVTNFAGTVQSAPASVAVGVPPSIRTQPVAVTARLGVAARLSVVAQGSPTLAYQWQKDGVNISGATAASYLIRSAAIASAGSYRVLVSNAVGAVRSTEAKLTVLVPPRITQQPTVQTVAVDDPVLFSVAAVGTGTLTYQWRKAGVAIPGATSTTYAITAAKLTDATIYDVVVSSALGSVRSSASLLVVGIRPTILTPPVGRALNLGAALSLRVTAAGSDPFAYQWFRNGQPIDGAKFATYSVSSVGQANAGVYTVEVSNRVGRVTSQGATVTLAGAVTITKQPTSVNAVSGGSATFSVVASGTAPLKYQWKQGGVVLSGGTASSYTIPVVSASHTGAYTVVVSNGLGSVESQSAMLGLSVPAAAPMAGSVEAEGTVEAPTVTAHPAGLRLVAGGAGTLVAKVRSASQFRYQWKKDGVEIANGSLYAGAAGLEAGSAAEVPLSLRLLNASDFTAGNYTVTVTSAQDVTSSAGALVTVLFPKPKFLAATLVKMAQTIDLRGFTVLDGSVLVGVVPSNDTLRVSAVGAGQLSYSWRHSPFNNPSVQTPLVGQNSPALDFSLAAANLGPGNYTCIAIAGAASTELTFVITSFAVPVAQPPGNAEQTALRIVSEPGAVSANEGALVILGVEVTARNCTFLWFKEGAGGESELVSGGPLGFLRLDALQPADAGGYFVLVIDGEGFSVRSRVVSVTVLSNAD